MNDCHPLSTPQKEIWFDQLLHPEAPLYNIGGYIEISGAIEPDVFNAAVNMVIECHETLRTKIVLSEDGTPLQTFQNNEPVVVPLLDFSSEANAKEKALHWMQEHFTRPFELEEPPLFRHALLKLHDGCCYYWFVYHHLIVDGWGLSLVNKLICSTYNQLLQNKTPVYTSRPYTQYIHDDQQYTESPKYNESKRYWTKRFSMPPESLFKVRYVDEFNKSDLAADRKTLWIPAALYNRLHVFAKDLSASPVHVIIAALYIYFTRTTHKKFLTIGLPVHNRNNAVFKQTVGLFAGVFATPLQFEVDSNLRQFIQYIKHTLRSDYRYQRLPVSTLRRVLAASSDERPRLFDIQLNYANQNHDMAFNGCKGKTIALTNHCERTPLTLSIWAFHQGGDVQADFIFNRAFFNAREIEQIESRFLMILEYMLDHVEQPLYTIPLLTKDEATYIQGWNRTAVKRTDNQTIVDLFQSCALKFPDKPAVVFEDQTLTYGELNSQADQLSFHLNSLGTRAEDLIGICLDRSLDLVVGWLAVLKAGAAFVPLDAGYPNARLRSMLDDASPAIVLTQNHLRERLPVSAGTPVVCMESAWRSAELGSSGAPFKRIDPLQAAYVIYTSGSTGLPKGVMVTHASLYNLSVFQNEAFEVYQAGRVLQFASPSFDAACSEFAMTLPHGAALHLSTPDRLLPSPAFVNLMDERCITHVTLPPSVLSVLPHAPLPSLKVLVAAGEACSAELAAVWSAGRKMINAYGPTEAAVCASIAECEPGDEAPAIGKPIAGTQLFILDAELSTMPPGVAGELCIAGDGLARGYLNRADLTAEKFVPASLFGQTYRIYKTGDRARLKPSGELEFLGRLDHQIKLRGFRIELGEIEATLRRHQAVKETVVVPLADDQTRLAAYFTTTEPSAPTAEDLGVWLKTYLPDYMIPAHFMHLPGFPLTPNGKIDRKGLPRFTHAPQAVEQIPGTRTEKVLCDLWSRVLGLEISDCCAHFFRMGGHSLLAGRLATQVQAKLAVTMPLKVIFDRPVLKDQAAWLDQQTPAAETTSISPLPENEPLQVSFAQNRMWFLAQLEGQSAIYNMPLALHVKGALDPLSAEAAFATITQRHQSLRLCFPSVQGQAAVQPTDGVNPFFIIDFSGMPEAIRETEVDRLLVDHARIAFDLTRGPLLRLHLINLTSATSSEREHLLLINMHHIISDGWSMGVLMREWSRFYRRFRKDRSRPVDGLPPLPIQYTDFAAWQRRLMTDGVLERQFSYWRTKLEGAPPRLELPTDFPRAATRDHAGRRLQAVLGKSLSQTVQHFSRTHGATPFMTLLAAFKVLLFRYSGQTDLLVGGPIANRTQHQTEDLIGCFVNTLVFRSRIEAQQPFSRLLEQVGAGAVEAYSNQDLPFEYLVEKLNPTRDLSYSPLFQIMFVLQNTPVDFPAMDGLNIAVLEPEYPVTRFDLTLSISEKPTEDQGSTLVCDWAYRADLFHHDTIARMSRHFEGLLAEITANPERPPSRYNLLTESEMRGLLAWDERAVPFPKGETLVDLIQMHARRTPDKIAVVYDGEALSYQALGGRSDQLAAHLRMNGVGPETIAAVCLERSLELPVAWLGVLKSGGAFLPLDPNFPPLRLQYMLTDAAASVLLTQDHLLEKLSPPDEVKAVCLDRIPSAPIQPDSGQQPSIEPDAMAYVIYTSGSTGKPKGAPSTHRGFHNLAVLQSAGFAVTTESRVLQFAALSFDAVCSEFAVSLSQGAQFHLSHAEKLLPTYSLVRLLKARCITHVTLPPSALAVLPHDPLPHLEVLIVAGEPCPADLPATWSQNRRFINAYGLTETTVCTTLKVCRADDGRPTVGRPIPNTRVYLLDAYHNPTPVGVPGELCVAGYGLARGYLNRADLTAEKFVPAPPLGQGERIYKTGDLARRRPDGEIEFLGRLDHQIKLRGYRVEPAEIEAVLRGHEAVKEAVVVAVGPSGNRLPAAFITLDPSAETKVDFNDSAGARAWLKTRLPEYMTPRHFIVMAELPVTPNGKIDRHALQSYDLTVESQQRGPRTEVEQLLHRLWSRVLGVEVPGMDSDFFEIGGHSLTATRLVSHIRDTFDVEMPVRVVFDQPRLQQQAEWLQRSRSDHRLPPLAAMPRTETPPLSFTQKRLWFIARLEGQNAAYNIPSAFAMAGPLHIRAMERAWLALVERHQSLRMCFPEAAGKPTLQILPAYNPLVMVDLSGLPDALKDKRGDQILDQHAGLGFDLSRGPLLSLRLLRFAPQHHVLSYNMHHIISDGWSAGVLIRDWNELYDAFCRERKPQSPPLPVQYGDYAYWQHKWFKAGLLEKQLAYWTQKLAGVNDLLQLAWDRPRPPIQSHRGDHVWAALDVDLTRQVQHFCRDHGFTEFMVLLAVFKTVLSRFSGQTDLVVGAPNANRPLKATEDLVGFFVNSLPLRSQLSPSQTFSAFLAQIRQTTLEALSHQDLPFEHLVEKINPRRGLSFSPIFQVMFSMQNTPMEPAALQSLHLKPLEPHTNTARLDITLSCGQRDDRLMFHWEYATDLFDADTITRMSDHFQMILEAVLAQPELPLSQLPRLTAVETAFIEQWNQTETAGPRDKSVVALFQDQVLKTPQAIALRWEARQLDYAGLNEAANRLCHYLQRQGVTAGNVTAVCLDHSIEWVVVLLAVLKAGGAYVLLDKRLPKTRLRFKLDSARASLLITDGPVKTLTGIPIQTVDLSADRSKIALSPESNPTQTPEPENAAYLQYSSDAFGVLKGALVSHGALLNYVQWARRTYEPEQGGRVPFLTAGTLDTTVTSIYPPLISGAALEVVDGPPASALVDAAQSSGPFAYLKLSPSQFSRLCREVSPKQWHRMTRKLIIAGDALSTAHCRQWREQAQGVQLFFEYGPMETTVGCYAQNCSTEDSPSVGRPIDNTQLFILDGNLEPPPPGIPGELCIAGAGLAIGYHRREALNDTHFVQSTIFGKRRRIFRSGVQARLLPDTGLEILGRLDRQIKLNGYRIHPSEVEAAACGHSLVSDAVALVPEGDERLYLYAALVEPCIGGRELQRWLADRLPSYMRPAQVIILKMMPRTFQGEIDRQILAKFSKQETKTQSVFENQTQTQLAAFWSQVLKRKVDTVQLNFFEAGGHSLLAVQLASRIHQGFGVNMPLRLLFERPTLFEQAAWLADQRGRSSFKPIPKLADDTPPPLSFAQQRLWFLVQLEESDETYNVPAAVSLRGGLDVPAMAKALSTLIERHPGLRTCFPTIEGEPTIAVRPAYDPLRFTDLAGIPKQERDRISASLVEAHAHVSFNLDQGPLFRAHLLRTGVDAHILLVNIHHIISDGWSVNLLIRDWIAFYNALIRGRVPEAQPADLQYSDFAAWQREQLAEDGMRQRLAWWRETLTDAPALIALPTDYSRPASARYPGRQLVTQLAPAVGDSLKERARQKGATDFMAFLTVFGLLLSRYSGQDDLVVGTPVANRNHQQIEHMVGFFVNTLAPRHRMDENGTFLDQLDRVRVTTLEAFDRQDIPFEMVVEALNPSRDLRHSPIFQVMFELQTNPLERVAFDGLETSLLEIEPTTAKFDLSLVLSEKAGGLQCAWEYRSDLFRPETIAKLAAHFEMLAARLGQNPSVPMRQISMLTQAEDDRLLQWSRSPYVPVSCGAPDLVSRFQAQAAHSPARIALASQDGQVDYATLDSRSNRLAHRLLQAGVTPGATIGLCLDRSFNALTALFAVMKAGGAYVPLNANLPEARLRHMLRLAAVSILISDDAGMARLPWLDALDVPLLNLDQLEGDGPTGNDRPPEIPINPDLPAYLVFTSGSTGAPKGVAVSHGNALNAFEGWLTCYRLDELNCHLQMADFSFDVFGGDWIRALGSGGKLYLCPRERLLEPDRLYALILAQQIDCAEFVPAVIRGLIAHLENNKAKLDSMRLVAVGSDSWTLEEFERLKSVCPSNTRVINSYGVSEATIDSTFLEYTALQLNPQSCVPIGKPFPDVQVYVLDRYHNPLPQGVPGRLVIGGKGVSLGYWNQADLTAERFHVIDLFGNPRRVYDTGDMARLLPDGNLEFLGRRDYQIKLRGFRIELVEIEQALNAHEAVTGAVALLDKTSGNPSIAAYVTLNRPLNNDAGVLRDWLAERLPEHMVPAGIQVLERFPQTPSGKIDRGSLPQINHNGKRVLQSPRSAMEKALCEIWKQVLQLEKVGIHDNFFDLGGHSLLTMQVRGLLQSRLGLSPPVVELFQFPTIASLAAHLSKEGGLEEKQPAREPEPRPASSPHVAIIGVAGRFPGAADIDAFWDNLRHGRESIRFFEDEELIQAGVSAELVKDPRYVKAFGYLEHATAFDAGFFGYTPAEAEIMDPQQRVFLETAWSAFENAGYDVSRLELPVGVFVGTGINTYIQNIWSNAGMMRNLSPYQVVLGNEKDFTAMRTAYDLNLKGPAIAVQTACSSSLTAVNMACRSVLAGECDMALAGGVSISLPQMRGYLHQEGMIASPDGHCRAFDAEAQGTVSGSGAGVVVLKRLDRAIADNDTIHAVIKGFAVNNDGRGKVGFTAPSVEGQANVISKAMRGIDFESIDYLEAHGTATPLGDVVEIGALCHAYRAQTDKKGFAAIGSVKTNIGHLDTASGVAGLIKTVLALQHGEIPASLHFRQPNPRIAFEESPFYVNDRLIPWPDRGPRRAAVSSFGIGGANCHLVLEQAPEQPVNQEAPARPHLIPLSAKNPAAMTRLRTQLADYMAKRPAASLRDTAYTLALGRKFHEHRGFLVVDHMEGLRSALKEQDTPQWRGGTIDGEQPNLVFLFPGQGSQYPRMAAGLYEDEPVFRGVIDQCADYLKPHLEKDLRRLLFAGETTAGEMQETRCAQPALFAVEYALARLFIHWGLKPTAMMGHSIGEYVAACLAGVFELEDALFLVAARGRAMQAQTPGGMMAVSLPASELEPLLDKDLSIAAYNAPAQLVVSGPDKAIDRLAAVLKGKQVECRRLHTSHAFHSRMMAPMIESFRALLHQRKRNPPTLPFISNLTGGWITTAQAVSADYWCDHLLQAVNFSKGLGTLINEVEHAFFLELGPGHGCCNLLRQHSEDRKSRAVPVLPSAAEAKRDPRGLLLEAVGQLWLADAPLDWRAFYGHESHRRIPLPAYPFERISYYVEPGASLTFETADQPAEPRQPLDNWFFRPGWTPGVPVQLEPAAKAVEPGVTLVFADAEGIAATAAQQTGAAWVYQVVSGGCFQQTGVLGFEIDPTNPEDFRRLFDSLAHAGHAPQTILHAWSLDADEDLESSQAVAFYSLLYLVQTWPQLNSGRRLFALSKDLHRITGDESIPPFCATLLGPLQTIGAEYPDIQCRSIDLASRLRPGSRARLIKDLTAELTHESTQVLVAYRNGSRWLRDDKPIRLPEPAAPLEHLPKGGHFLITGGLGGMGLTLADYLAEKLQARLTLLGRSPFPEQRDWSGWPKRNPRETRMASKIDRLQAMVDAGAQVQVVQADISSRQQLGVALERACQAFGPLNGIIHAAGVSDDGIAALKQADQTRRVLAPKVAGTVALCDLVDLQALDCLVFCSSLNAIMEIPGRIDYCAANAFQDAYAEYLAGRGVKVVSIEWDGWREVGMAADEANRTAAGREVQNRDPGGINPAEGIDVFARILANPLHRVGVSTTDWLERQRRHQEHLQKRKADWRKNAERVNTSDAGNAREGLTTTYAAPRNGIEIELAEIWETLLGVQPVGIHDNFFELGGHSLLMTQLLVRLHEAFAVKLTMQEIFECPSILNLADHIQKLRDVREQLMTPFEPASEASEELEI